MGGPGPAHDAQRRLQRIISTKIRHRTSRIPLRTDLLYLSLHTWFMGPRGTGALSAERLYHISNGCHARRGRRRRDRSAVALTNRNQLQLQFWDLQCPWGWPTAAGP